MHTHADKTSETKSTSMANGPPRRQCNDRATFQLVDNRPEATAPMKVQELANDSPQVSRLRVLQQLANNNPRVSQLRSLQVLANNSPQAKQPTQLQALADATSPSPIQEKIANGIAQLAQESEEKELNQAKPQSAQRQTNETDSKPRPNNTGLPDNLKSGIEALSGLSLDHVKVHYNSAQPAQLNALAYAQGSDIHLAPGQEQHLPHEAWHLVQQAQGRVQPTLQMKDGVPVNDDAGLEREADVMGGRASNVQAARRRLDQAEVRLDGLTHLGAGAQESMVVQREPSEREKEMLKARVKEKYDEYRFQTRPDGHELAIGSGHYYMLIRTNSDSSYWRKYNVKRPGGRGFFGRLGDNPPTMDQIGDSINQKEALQSTPLTRLQAMTFSPVTPVRDRGNNNTVMGNYFLNRSIPMPASVYARTQYCEWLHMHGHGLGGAEVPENLYAGSHAANSHMAAIESAVQEMSKIYPTGITITVMVSTDADYHDTSVCTDIALDLKLDPTGVYNLMQRKESRMLEFIEYQVAVNGQTVWTETILPFQEGRFDEAQFIQLKECVVRAIQGQPNSIKFVSGGILPGSGYGDDSGGGSGMDSSDMEM